MAFRFVHAADIHLDSPLRSLLLRDEEIARLISGASRSAFSRIVDLCLEEKADALLISGDLYDGDQTSMKTARFLAEELYRLHQAGIRSFIVRGNHDALSKITRELSLPPSVTVFSGRASVEVIEPDSGKRIAIHGLSFAQPQAPDSLLSKYRPPVEGAVNIGMMHTSLNGAPGHDRYAPVSEKALFDWGYDYWALGHVHKRAVYERDGRFLVMPGIPQGRDINESGPKSATLVEIDDQGRIQIEERLTGAVQFERVAIDLSSAQDWEEALALTQDALKRAREGALSDYLAARVILEGETPIAWRLRHDADLLLEDVRLQAKMLETGVLIEKIDLRAAPAAAEKPENDPLSELEFLAREEALQSPAYRHKIAQIAEELKKQLPRDHARLYARDQAEWENWLALQIEEGLKDVLAWLRPKAESPD